MAIFTVISVFFSIFLRCDFSKTRYSHGSTLDSSFRVHLFDHREDEVKNLYFRIRAQWNQTSHFAFFDHVSFGIHRFSWFHSSIARERTSFQIKNVLITYAYCPLILYIFFFHIPTLTNDLLSKGNAAFQKSGFF